MRFTSEWMELEEKKTFPGPEGQTWNVLTHKWILGVKYRKTSLQSTAPEKLGN